MNSKTDNQKIEFIRQCAKGISLFNGRYTNFKPGQVPFYVSPDPFRLSKEIQQEMSLLGRAISKLFLILAKEHKVNHQYLFFRPDLLLTQEGYKVCEVETSLFGYPLAVFLERAYTFDQPQKDYLPKSCVEFGKLWKDKTGFQKGTFLFSNHTRHFLGQFEYLASMFNSNQENFEIKILEDNLKPATKKYFYRCFYTFQKDEMKRTKKVHNLLPTQNGYFETKKPLVEWTTNLELRNKMTTDEKNILDKYLLPTWVIDENAVPDNFMFKIKNWVELAKVSKSNRKIVIKRIGDHPDASWAKSVVFGHKVSGLAVEKLIAKAISEPGEWIIQPFINSTKVVHNYYSPSDKKIVKMKGRVRLTPYHNFDTGEWIVGKATIRRNTLLIHGATDSINTFVEWDLSK